MKLITQFSDIEKANQYQLILRKAGVLAHVSSSNSYMLSQVRTGALKVGVWVVLDEQFADAKSLLSNPNHKVKLALSEEHLVALEREAKKSQLSITQRIFENIAAWTLALFLSWRQVRPAGFHR